MMDPAAELDFTGKTIVVTGSSRNIGRAIVLEFAGRGANVVINTRSNEEEARVVEREVRDAVQRDKEALTRRAEVARAGGAPVVTATPVSGQETPDAKTAEGESGTPEGCAPDDAEEAEMTEEAEVVEEAVEERIEEEREGLEERLRDRLRGIFDR